MSVVFSVKFYAVKYFLLRFIYCRTNYVFIIPGLALKVAGVVNCCLTLGKLLGYSLLRTK